MNTPVVRGFHSAVLSDMLTHRQIYVERLKSGLHGELNTVTRAVFDSLLQALADNRVVSFNEANSFQLRNIVKAVLKQYDLATQVYIRNVTAFLTSYAAEEANFYETAIRRVIVVPEEDEQEVYTEEELASYLAPIIIGATGFTAAQTLKNLTGDMRTRIQSTIQRARVQGFDTTALLEALSGTTAASQRNGLFARLRNFAAATVDTIIQAGMAAARTRVMQRLADYILGYAWVSVLDARTSAICRSLSGRTFRYGEGPVPPMHIRCRSHIEPLFSPMAAVRAGMGQVFTAGETYYSWLKRQDPALQNSVLGSSRAAIFRKGGLTPEQFGTIVLSRSYQPLTLAELRKRNPEIFARAGL